MQSRPKSRDPNTARRSIFNVPSLPPTDEIVGVIFAPAAEFVPVRLLTLTLPVALAVPDPVPD